VSTPSISISPSTFDYGQPWSLVATGAQPNAMAVVNFGDSISSLGAISLPLALDAIGAPGCFLNTNIVSSIATVTDANGDVEVGYTIPGSLFGLLQPSYFQIVTMTTGNTLGFVTSEYLEIR
jgi:hypothetical protein